MLHWIDTCFDALAGLGIVIGVLAAAVGMAAAVVWRLAQVLLRKVPDNGFGSAREPASISSANRR